MHINKVYDCMWYNSVVYLKNKRFVSSFIVDKNNRETSRILKHEIIFLAS